MAKVIKETGIISNLTLGRVISSIARVSITKDQREFQKHFDGLNKTEKSEFHKGISSISTFAVTILTHFQRFEREKEIILSHADKVKYIRLFLKAGSNYKVRVNTFVKEILPEANVTVQSSDTTGVILQCY